MNSVKYLNRILKIEFPKVPIIFSSLVLKSDWNVSVIPELAFEGLHFPLNGERSLVNIICHFLFSEAMNEPMKFLIKM